jgi:HD-GYP domain-containing protein (c-di-GMP phosphodiesterase class II)
VQAATTNLFFYLLSSEIEIADVNGNCFDVVGGSTESRRPLMLHPRDRVKAIARTQTGFVRFSVDLMRLETNSEYETVILDEITQTDEDLEKRVLFEVYHALMSENLVLPSLPDVAIRIREAANNENTSVEDVASVIGADPSTAAYCIGVATNAAAAGASQIDNVLDAVVRMGIQPTRNIVVAYTMRSLFKGKDPLSKKLMRDAWTHSCRIAALSYILARDVAKLNAERTLLAGLLHDIGITVVISEA